MNGLLIDGERPTTKLSVREALHEDPWAVVIEDTDSAGLAPERPVKALAEGEEVEVCGPDPYTDRRWTGTITRANGRIIIR